MAIKVSPRPKEKLTTSSMDRYLDTLSQDTKDLFNLAYKIARDTPDTNTEQFRIAALVVGIFQDRALTWLMQPKK